MDLIPRWSLFGAILGVRPEPLEAAVRCSNVLLKQVQGVGIRKVHPWNPPSLLGHVHDHLKQNGYGALCVAVVGVFVFVVVVLVVVVVDPPLVNIY